MEECKGCYYNTETSCLVFKERRKNCDNYTDWEEAEKREREIKEYTKTATPIRCEPVKEVLRKHFLKLYHSDYNDTEIGDILDVSSSSVGEYRRELGLKIQSKNKKSLREQAK